VLLQGALVILSPVRAVLVVGALLSGGGSAAAATDYHLVLGPSVGFATGNDLDTAPMLSVDLTFARMTSDASRSFIPNIKGILWFSAGCRFMTAGEALVMPYAEVGGWLLLNLGVGYSAAAGGPEARGRHFFHLFVGAPLLLTLLVDDLPVLVEPYWRPMLGEQTLHEVGMLIKYILPL